jgi:hypothetical protein
LSSPPVARHNFFVRHWRGELPLWLSYWVVGTGTNLLALGVAALLAAATRARGYNPLAIFVAVTTIWTMLSAALLWQVVGTWRSALRYIARRSRRFWGYGACAMLVLGVAQYAATFVRQGVPQLSLGWQIAFMGDPELPPYTLRLLRDGTELLVAGGFKYGLSADLQKRLDAAPSVRIVHLDSPGGRMGEADEVYRIIRSRGLTTYVPHACASACTIAFMGGRQRLKTAGAKLGFHQADLAGTSEPGAFRGDASLRQAGVAGDFLARVEATPASSIWYPTDAELRQAGVITAVVEPADFAVSTAAPASRSDVETSLRSVPLYATLSAFDPAAFRRAVDLVYDGTVAGRSQAELVAAVRQVVLPVIKANYVNADAATLLEVGRLALDETKYLETIDVALCYAFGAGRSVGRDPASAFSSELRARELDVDERVLRTARPGPAPDEQDVQHLWGRIRGTLVKRFGARVAVLSQDQVGAGDYATYCSVSIGMFQEILALPDDDAATLLRWLFGHA